MNIPIDLNANRGGDAPRRPAPAPKRVLVTGGAGFLGSHLCRRLLEDGHHVVCLDNLMSGQRRNIADMVSGPRFRFIEHDVIAPLPVEAPFDFIYNLACPASPPTYQKDPVHTFQTCITGALNVLNLARETGARVLQASTSEVYGDPQVTPQQENYCGNVNTCGPRACYDEGKRGAETLFHDYNAQFGVDIRIARIFNTYGPCMSPDDGRVISNFVVQALSGQDITVMGDGSQTRSFCYRDDLVEGLMRFMEHPAPYARPVNFGRPDEYAVLTMAHKIVKLTGSRSRIVFKALPVDDPRQRCPDISVAQALLGWTPRTTLDQGLRRTITHFSALASGGTDAHRDASHKAGVSSL